ncbi:MAG: hypothetical protein R3F34_10830 [Planctomycetota bacterium]
MKERSRGERGAATCSAILALLVAQLVTGCGDEPPSTSPVDATPAVDDAPSGAEPADGVESEGGLDLAVLPPLPEFAQDPSATAAGHVVSHRGLSALGAADDDAPELTWEQLAAPDYEAPLVASDDERPALDDVLHPAVLAARDTRVTIDGFATLERARSGVAVEIVLTPLPPTCCLGRTPRADERVHVEVPEALALVVDPYQPLRVVGTFAAEERRDALGLYEGVYFLVADRVQGGSGHSTGKRP